MSTIGIELDQDALVLTRGRDFKWLFDNLAEDGVTPEDFPDGELYFELLTGGEHNALQEVKVLGATDGTYKFTYDGQTTGNIDYYDVTVAPHGMDGDITDALEALPNIGAGNVFVHPAQLFPEWKISLTLNAGVNEKQQILFANTTGGQFKLSYGLDFTPVLTYGATPTDIQTALRALPGIGSGNCTVTAIPGGYEVEFIGAKANTNMDQILCHGWGVDMTWPTWFFGLTGVFPTISSQTVVQGSSKLTEPMVNMLNKTINDMFNTFDTMLGVDIDVVVYDNKNVILRCTSLKSFVESDIITWATDVTGTLVKSFLNSVSMFFGIFNTVSVDFWWNHVYRVEFVGALGNKAQPALIPDITSLVGAEKAVEVKVLKPGKARMTKWQFTIAGTTASLKVESEEADKIPPRTKWQLVFLPDGEAAGGDAVALGRVWVQGA